MSEEREGPSSRNGEHSSKKLVNINRQDQQPQLKGGIPVNCSSMVPNWTNPVDTITPAPVDRQ